MRITSIYYLVVNYKKQNSKVQNLGRKKNVEKRILKNTVLTIKINLTKVQSTFLVGKKMEKQQ